MKSFSYKMKTFKIKVLKKYFLMKRIIFLIKKEKLQFNKFKVQKIGN